MPPASQTLPPPSPNLDELRYVEPVIPPGVSEDVAFSIRQQSRQHYERRVDTRLLTQAVTSGNSDTFKKLTKLEDDLREKPGKMEVRAIMIFAASVFLLMIYAAFQKNGIDSEKATKNAQQMLGPLSPQLTE